jgi:hypothetical protein
MAMQKVEFVTIGGISGVYRPCGRKWAVSTRGRTKTESLDWIRFVLDVTTRDIECVCPLLDVIFAKDGQR